MARSQSIVVRVIASIAVVLVAVFLVGHFVNVRIASQAIVERAEEAAEERRAHYQQQVESAQASLVSKLQTQMTTLANLAARPLLNFLWLGSEQAIDEDQAEAEKKSCLNANRPEDIFVCIDSVHQRSTAQTLKDLNTANMLSFVRDLMADDDLKAVSIVAISGDVFVAFEKDSGGSIRRVDAVGAMPSSAQVLTKQIKHEVDLIGEITFHYSLQYLEQAKLRLEEQIGQELATIDQRRKAEAKDMTMRRTVEGLVFFCLVIVAVYLVTRQTVLEPLRGLTSAAKRLESGDFDQAVPMDRNDELGILANGFEHMRRALGRRFGDLRLMNEAGEVMSQARDYDSCLAELVTIVSKKIPCSAAALMRFGDKRTKTVAQWGAWGDQDVQVIAGEHRTLLEDRSDRVVSIREDGSQLRILLALHDSARSINGALVLEVTPEVASLDEQDGNLLTAFAGLTSICVQNIAYLEEVEEKGCLEVQLEAAEVIQNRLLPSTTKIPGFEWAAAYDSADQLGGDWYDWRYNEKTQLLDICIADVTGHGFPASLLTGVGTGAMNAAREILDFRVDSKIEPKERMALVMETLNMGLKRAGATETLVTMFYASICARTGKFWFCNASHRFPFVRRASGKVDVLVGKQTVILGLHDEAEAIVMEGQLEPGDDLFLYTDGLVENGPTSKQQLKVRELRNLLKQGGSVEELVERVRARSMELWKSGPLEDDSSLFVCRWLGSSESKNHAS